MNEATKWATILRDISDFLALAEVIDRRLSCMFYLTAAGFFD